VDRRIHSMLWRRVVIGQNSVFLGPTNTGRLSEYHSAKVKGMHDTSGAELITSNREWNQRLLHINLPIRRLVSVKPKSKQVSKFNATNAGTLRHKHDLFKSIFHTRQDVVFPRAHLHHPLLQARDVASRSCYGRRRSPKEIVHGVSLLIQEQGHFWPSSLISRKWPTTCKALPKVAGKEVTR
jgi:hypothetical protein